MHDNIGLYRGMVLHNRIGDPNLDWVYGNLVEENRSDRCFIGDLREFSPDVPLSDVLVEVDPDSVGMCTGVPSSQGSFIYEGDMLKPFDDEYDKIVVEYHKGCFLVVMYGTKGSFTESGYDEDAGGYGVLDCEVLNYYPASCLEVIGTVYSCSSDS